MARAYEGSGMKGEERRPPQRAINADVVDLVLAVAQVRNPADASASGLWTKTTHRELTDVRHGIHWPRRHPEYMVFANTTPTDPRLRIAARQVLAASGCGPMRPRPWTSRPSGLQLGDPHRDDGDLRSLTVPPTSTAPATTTTHPAQAATPGSAWSLSVSPTVPEPVKRVP
jgi:hypothetical protein